MAPLLRHVILFHFPRRNRREERAVLADLETAIVIAVQAHRG